MLGFSPISSTPIGALPDDGVTTPDTTNPSMSGSLVVGTPIILVNGRYRLLHSGETLEI